LTLFRRITFVAIVYTFVIIAWGAFVRFSGSGDGCGKHWPLCQGYILPGGPGSQMLATWIEFIHRAKSGLLGLLILGLGLASLKVFPKRHLARKAAASSVFFMITEALLGAWLVLAGLVNDNHSNLRVFAVGVHSINTLFLLGSLVLLFVWSHFKNPNFGWRNATDIPRSLTVGTVAGFLILAVTGALASLGQTMFPSESLTEGWTKDFHPESHWILRIRLFHPFLAVAVAGFFIALSIKLSGHFKSKVESLRKNFPLIVLATLVIGLTTLVSLSPTSLRLVHLVFADLLWSSLLCLIAFAYTKESA